MTIKRQISSVFHHRIIEWFSTRYGEPTDIQQKAWDRISKGDHVLMSAATGSGKTLAAFLWALNALISEIWPSGVTSVLYISPLKALNNDIQRNLFKPLNEIRQIFESHNESFPIVNILTRSGDTPPSHRRRMLKTPPEIVITTPESLNLLLSSQSGRKILHTVRTVILDEIHDVVRSKRGVYLMSAVENLVLLAGEFQRIALSATINPMETVAKYVGGYRLSGSDLVPEYSARTVIVLQSSIAKPMDITIETPLVADIDTRSVWDAIAKQLKDRLQRNRSTVIFTNSRRLCERITNLVNEDEEFPLAYSHHGALSKELRLEVERQLKDGRLKAIVATNTLELGIDIGHLDEVVMIQSPPSVSSAIQRIGRAGHRVGSTSRGCFMSTHLMDTITSVVLRDAVLKGDTETVSSPGAPLDVLSQIIISLYGQQVWNIDALFNQIKTCFSFHELEREHFDGVIEMLAGRYDSTRIRELQSQVFLDRIDNTIKTKPGTVKRYYISGGVIPDRGYYRLRHKETLALVGDLDEEFVWEAFPGKTFSFGSQLWQIKKITHNDVLALPVARETSSIPFWRGEGMDRDFHLSMRISEFLEDLDKKTENPDDAEAWLLSKKTDSAAAKFIIEACASQKRFTRTSLPHRHHVLVEWVDSGPQSAPGNQMLIHTFWGGKVNKPYALALRAAWEKIHGYSIEVFPSNDVISVLLPEKIDTNDLITLVTPSNVMDLLHDSLGNTGIFGARFRESAGIALLLAKRKFGERTPLWMTRLRSQKLFSVVQQYHSFPILIETWRTCLQDDFDMAGLSIVLDELISGIIQITECRTATPSPFGKSIAWRQINQYMYSGDEPSRYYSSAVSRDVIHDLVAADRVRLPIPKDVVNNFQSKKHRNYPGYSPSDPEELLDWIKDRLLIPFDEMKVLCESIRRDHQSDPDEWLHQLEGKIAWSQSNGPDSYYWFAREITDKIDILRESKADYEESQMEFLMEWLRFYGPITADDIKKTLGIPEDRLLPMLQSLVDSRHIVSGNLVKDSDREFVCDIENYEILLRIIRARRRPLTEPLPVDKLQLLLAMKHGLTEPSSSETQIENTMDQLEGYRAPADFWETEILPARIAGYCSSMLDVFMQHSGLMWLGNAPQNILFYFPSNLDLFFELSGEQDISSDESNILHRIMPDPEARYSFVNLVQRSGVTPSDLLKILMRKIWEGLITCDSFDVIRKAVLTKFKMPDLERMNFSRSGRHRRFGVNSGFHRWRETMPYSGNWMRVPLPHGIDNFIEHEELKKDRVRVILNRYGIVNKEQLQFEDRLLGWKMLIRTLQSMELSGEITTGYFFKGISGPQFISHIDVKRFQQSLPETSVYWMNAADPVSICGRCKNAFGGKLPKRFQGNYVVFRGSELLAVYEKQGSIMRFYINSESPEFERCLEPLHHMLTRQFKPLSMIKVRVINGEPAVRSSYVKSLKKMFDVSVDPREIVLTHRFQ
ncbi:DEAD/DEAH box helicase [bacterium]|nr:DEAD/DEAH box helicase [candidate division CSSED10-310 bacterium]